MARISRRMLVGSAAVALVGGILVASTPNRQAFQRLLTADAFESSRYGTQVTWDSSLWPNQSMFDHTAEDNLFLGMGQPGERTRFTVASGPRHEDGLHGAIQYLRDTYWQINAWHTDRDELFLRTSSNAAGTLHAFRDRGKALTFYYCEIWLQDYDNRWPSDDQRFWVSPALWVVPGAFDPDRTQDAVSTIRIDGSSPFRLAHVNEIVDAVLINAPAAATPDAPVVATPAAD